VVSKHRQLALDAITARSCLIAEPQLNSLLAELASEPPQRRRRVRDSTIFPHLAPQTALRDAAMIPSL